MMKLPKSIISKYGITKKAWSVFRHRKTTKTRSVNTMPRHRRRFGHRSSGGVNPMNMVLASALYGAIRQPIGNMIQGVVPSGTLSGYADEAILGVTGYFLAKKGKGFMKALGMSALVVESASVGHQVTAGYLGTSTMNTSSATGWY